MRVEQQNTNIIDVLQQSIGPEAKEGSVLLEHGNYSEYGVAFENQKAKMSVDAKSVNLKDATYMKPEKEAQKSAVEEMEQSGTLDAAERKSQMVVLANTTSPEDYAKMQEEGFSLDETISNTIVTETDKIKAQLAKAGVDISVFGDELDMAQLEAITGSAELAMQLAQAFEKADVPCTDENMKDAAEAVKLAETLQKPSDAAIKYMLDNELDPTIENLYKAGHSGNYQLNENRAVDLTPFLTQVEKIICQSGLAVDEQTKAASQWLLQHDVPLNEDNLKYFMALSDMNQPLDMIKLMENMATAVAEGGRPQDAMMMDGYTLREKAEETFEVITKVTDADLSYVIKNGMDMNVQSLAYAVANRENHAQAGDVVAGDEPKTVSGAALEAVSNAYTDGSQNIAADGKETVQYTREGLALLTARRQLEEARLAMSAEANFSLLKRGIEIDTISLERLVEELKANENAYYENLLKAQGAEVSEENVKLFRETTEKVSELKTVPAYVLGMRGAKTATVTDVHKAGIAMQDTFEKANERYETLMTAPRADLGDSIQKAFRNVDVILDDLGLELTEENRRAVRILGYNQIEITTEAVAEMKDVDEEVQRAFRNLTPATVTEMIKRGINPLDMDFASVNDMAEQIGNELGGQDERKFGEFLWKLEKSNGITEEERASYIGVYRLIHQVEQTDGAAIGALVHQGAEVTMRNLMMAVRTDRHTGKMDYSVDEAFGASENTGYMGTSIIEQIETSYQSNCLKDVADALTPGKLRALAKQNAEWENMTPEQLKEALTNADSDELQLDYEYAKEQLAELSRSAKVTQDIYTVLQKYDIPNTMSNIMAMEAMVKNRNGMFRQLLGKRSEDADAQVADEFAAEKESVCKAFEEAVSSPDKMAAAQEELHELAEQMIKSHLWDDEVTSLDVKEMRLLSAQLSISDLLAKEEQYSVPVMVSDGIVNVSLKIVRGDDRKGTVDIMMESEQHGKIAASFQAKEQGVKGLIAVENQETKTLLETLGGVLKENLGEEESAELHYAHISDLDLGQFSMGLFGIDANPSASSQTDLETYQVQTGRLYHIAETFIRQIREVL